MTKLYDIDPNAVRRRMPEDGSGGGGAGGNANNLALRRLAEEFDKREGIKTKDRRR